MCDSSSPHNSPRNLGTRPPTPEFEDIFGEFSDIFSDLFQGTPGRGADLRDELWLDLTGAAEGGQHPLVHPVTKKQLAISVPPGTDSGQVLRLAGQGAPGTPAGHLYLTIRVRTHPELSREGAHIIHTAIIDRRLAREGGDILVPSLHGPLELTVPPKTQTGDRITLAGCGAIKLGCPAAPFPGRVDGPFRAADVSSHRGDQIVEFSVRSRLVPAIGLIVLAAFVAGVFVSLWP